MLKIFFAFGILWVYEWFILQQGISWALQNITKTSVRQREIHKTFPERNLARHFEAVKVCDWSGKITKQHENEKYWNHVIWPAVVSLQG